MTRSIPLRILRILLRDLRKFLASPFVGIAVVFILSAQAVLYIGQFIQGKPKP